MFPNLGKVKHPNAARRLANYLMSKEGNAVLNAEPDNISIYDIGKLPREYRVEYPKNAARKDEINKLFSAT